MRTFLRGAVALIVLVAAYWSWALLGTAELASAASRGDAVAVTERIDLPALRRSLSSQIAYAYLEQNPEFRKMLALEQQFVGSVSAGAANELLRGILTPENIAALLKNGRVGLPLAGDVWRMPPLRETFRSGPLLALLNSHFAGPLSFVVDLDSAEGRFGVHMRLSGATWRLSGIDVPEQVSAQLAHAIADRVGELSQRRGRT